MAITHLIGIDPSFESCGIAILEPVTLKLNLFTGDMLEGFDHLNRSKLLKQSLVILENPALDQTLFMGWEWVKFAAEKYARRQVGIQAVESEFRKSSRLAMNVGQSKAAGQLWAKMLRANNVPVFEVRPSERHRVDDPKKAKMSIHLFRMPTKTNRKQFCELTGYDGRSSEHARDAATLVWGRNLAWANKMAEALNK